MTQSPENVPLDTRLLGNAVIEMNISRRTVSLYPGNHTLVEEALKRACRILEELLDGPDAHLLEGYIKGLLGGRSCPPTSPKLWTACRRRCWRGS